MGEESRLDQFLKSLLNEKPSLKDQLSNPVITEKDLTEILNAEMEKDEALMDTDLIDVCVEALLMIQQGPDAFKHEKIIPDPVPDDLKEYLAQNKLTQTEEASAPNLEAVEGKKPAPDDEKKKKRRRFRYIPLVAAVVTLLCAMAISSFAGVSPFKISEDVASFVDEYLKLDFGKAKTDAEAYTDTDNALTKELAENGFDSLILPKDLLSEEYKTNNISYNSGVVNNAVTIALKNNNKNSSITITKYDTLENLELFMKREYTNISQGTQLTINNMDVFVFTSGDYGLLTYLDSKTLTYYKIQVPGGQEEAMKIAESIQ